PPRPLRDLHCFPTRRSSDLEPAVRAAGVDNLLAFNSAARGGRSPSTEGLFAMESGGRVTRDDPAWEMLKRGHDFAQSQAGKPYQDRKSTRLNSSHVKISYAV